MQPPVDNATAQQRLHPIDMSILSVLGFGVGDPTWAHAMGLMMLLIIGIIGIALLFNRKR